MIAAKTFSLITGLEFIFLSHWRGTISHVRQMLCVFGLATLFSDFFGGNRFVILCGLWLYAFILVLYSSDSFSVVGIGNRIHAMSLFWIVKTTVWVLRFLSAVFFGPSCSWVAIAPSEAEVLVFGVLLLAPFLGAMTGLLSLGKVAVFLLDIRLTLMAIGHLLLQLVCQSVLLAVSVLRL